MENKDKDKNNNSSNSLVFGRWPQKKMLEKQSQENRSLSQDVKRKVVGWIPERAVPFSRLQSRDDDCNYYMPILCWLCFLIIVNGQLYLLVSLEFLH